MSNKPTVPEQFECVVDKLTTILIEEYGCNPEKITVTSDFWADGDFVVKAKGGDPENEYIDGTDKKVNTIQHMVRYHHSTDEGIKHRRYMRAEDYEETIEKWGANTNE